MSRGRRRRVIVVMLAAVGVACLYVVHSPKNYSATATQLGTNYYSVVEFFDGDTIAVNMNGTIEKVRLIGVDTPETHHPSKPVQCFGEAASNFTKQVIGSSRVRLEADATDTNRDRYGRLLRYVYLPDGSLVNQRIITEGFGFAYVGFPFTKLENFQVAQQVARQQAKGLWSKCPTEVDNFGQEHSL